MIQSRFSNKRVFEVSRTRRIIFTTFLVELLYFIVRGSISFMISYSEFGSDVLRNILFYTAPYFVGIVSCIVGAVLTYILEKAMIG